MALTSSLLYQTGNIAADTFVLTGPVIGMVTDSTARILIETNLACTVECRLKTRDDSQPPVRKVIVTRKRIPKCFAFEGLQPETYYKLSFNIACPGLVKSGFMTMPRAWSLMSSPARMGFVTGNNCVHTRDNVSEKLDLWRALFKLANKGELDYLVHLGNNVYLDIEDSEGKTEESRWQRAMKLLDGVEPVEWPSRYERICEIFRGGYRETWNHPMTKHVLANVPNLMILNDSDIRANFGDSPADSDPYSKEYFLNCCAYEIYNQYQRNLFEQYTAQAAPYACILEVRQAYHFHVFGDIAIMILDVRAAHTLHKSKHPEDQEQLPLLGSRQWKDIEFALSDTGYFSGCRMLFVVSPTPPAIVGEKAFNLFQSCRKPEEVKTGAWHNQQHLPEASLLLSLLFDWRARKPGLKEFCIVTSGIGQGFITDIVDLRYMQLYDGRLDRAKQIALGPISNGPPLPENKNLLSQGVGTVNWISPHHQFKHTKVSSDRQFAIIDVYIDSVNRGDWTKFTAQVTESDDKSLKRGDPIDASFRLRGNFKGTFFSLCDPGAKKRITTHNRNDHFALLSMKDCSTVNERIDDGVASINGTYDNISMSHSLELAAKAAREAASSSRPPHSHRSSHRVQSHKVPSHKPSHKPSPSTTNKPLRSYSDSFTSSSVSSLSPSSYTSSRPNTSRTSAVSSVSSYPAQPRPQRKLNRHACSCRS